MDQNAINKQIFLRLSRLEDTVFRSDRKAKTKKYSPDSLSNHIIALRDRGAFRNPLISKEVHEKLRLNYQCDLSRVKVELGRLQQRKQLRKSSKTVGGKEYVAYVW